ncbi:ABC transporter permease subunit [Paracholeplasma manati]|uniref:ABC transporter permease n=1 Tax=Paracholeplasma manati TaxID=591373 RepID=A0ABT2Y3E5_9MOLU|nr:hypothetical protein [Paracholeplasma manati]MCV2231266.1 hypothetical protein [Paracholeplasma manati]MDG0888344.1 hypothetical protein [Paracholeplasma manati]
MKSKYLNSVFNFIKDHNLISYSGFIVVSILFVIYSGRRLEYNIGVLLQTVSPYIIIALGGVLIYSLGNLDISIGQQIGVYIILMVMITNALGATFFTLFIAFMVILVLALFSGWINAYISAQLKLPSIVTSLFLMFIFTGVQFLLMSSTGVNSINLNIRIRPTNREDYNVLLLVIIIIFSLIYSYIFRFTNVGKYIRIIGANTKVAVQSGIQVSKYKIYAYFGFAVMIAVGSFLILMRTGSAGNGTGSGYHLDLMVILILGGMPLSGGMKSKMSSAIIGSLIFVLLSNVLATMGVSMIMINLVKALIFIVIVLLTSRSKDLILPR